jgi:hypothetical protein
VRRPRFSENAVPSQPLLSYLPLRLFWSYSEFIHFVPCLSVPEVPDTYDTAPFHGKLTIDPVALQHANGVCSNPEWTSGENLPQDWIDFIAGVIERSRKIRQHIEATPHQLEHA